MFPYFVLVAVLLLLLLFIVIPIVGSFVISFMDYNPLRQDGGNMFVGFSNYLSLLKDELFVKSLTNTLYYVFVMVGINLVMTLVIAHFLCIVSSNKWRSLFRVAFFLPCVAPLSAVSFVWTRSIFPTRGPLNMLLALFNVPAVNWLGNASSIMPSIILLSLWADVGYNIILFIAGIQGIPEDFFEAAIIDGAGALRSFISVTLPLLGRTMAFVVAMTFISQFQAFAQFTIVANGGGPGRAGYVLSTYIYDMGFKAKDMGYASAVSVALFFLMLIVTAVQQRLNRVDWGY